MVRNTYEAVYDTESELSNVREAYPEETESDHFLSPYYFYNSTEDDKSASDSSDVMYSETGSYDADILYQLQVTNSLLGISIALDIFLLAFFILIFFIKVIKNNVTNLFT